MSDNITGDKYTGRIIRIDYEDAGEVIMGGDQGVFRRGSDHSFSTHRVNPETGREEMLGGIVVAPGIGRSAMMHDAGFVRDWCSRDLLWMVFHYAFVQLGCLKVIGPVASDNYRALEQNLRGGWHLEAVIRDAVAPGVHIMLLTMTPAQCPWLKVIPNKYFPGHIVRNIELSRKDQ